MGDANASSFFPGKAKPPSGAPNPRAQPSLLDPSVRPHNSSLCLLGKKIKGATPANPVSSVTSLLNRRVYASYIILLYDLSA